MEDLVAAADVGLWGQVTPAASLIAAGVAAAVTPWRGVRKLLLLAGPVGAMALWLNAQIGVYGVVEVAGFSFETLRFDPLSRIFGLVFIIASFLNGVYALHDRNRAQDAMSLIYAGAGVGAVFAGDLLTLFAFWELTALSSVGLVMGAGGAARINAGLRYLAIHVGSGVLLLAGAAAHASATGSLAFGGALDAGGGASPYFDPATPGGALILLAIGIKCAFPLLHNWLQDSYPRATPVGAVVLSAFTTKLAVYALARGFAGYEPLIYIGAVMTVFPVFFAVIENDLRRVLAYSLNNQLGFMVCGVGIGTSLALNGAAAHAFCHIIYKALLFMSMGAVLHRTGTCKASELGGLYKTMPFTAIFCIIGAASISAFPLFSGFVSKSMILAAAAKEHYTIVWLMLLFASAGVLEHSGIKIPYFSFFGHDSGRRPREAPWNMVLAMGLAAFLCVYLALPLPAGWGGMGALYALLPFSGDYVAYTADHVLTQMQLLVAAAFAFAFLMRLKLYPPERPATILDTDWLYRRVGLDLARWAGAFGTRMVAHATVALGRGARHLGDQLHAALSPAGVVRRAVPDNSFAIATLLVLGLALIAALAA